MNALFIKNLSENLILYAMKGTAWMHVQQHYMPMPTTVGSVTTPLGQTRLQIARLVAMMIMTGQDSVIVELANLGTLSVLLVIPLCFRLCLRCVRFAVASKSVKSKQEVF